MIEFEKRILKGHKRRVNTAFDHMLGQNMADVKAKRSTLDNLARMYGLKRRWFGMEPDCLFRRRIAKVHHGVTRKVNSRKWGGPYVS